jgi:ATP-dependent RNA helicase RhlE
MFSATYSEDIRELASRFVKNPATIEVAARNATADKVEQTAYRVPKDHKRHLLAHLITEGNWHQVLVFARTKHGANRLSQQLEAFGIPSAAIHGNKSQGARVRALADFKANKVVALVATEVAARGLDIKELPHVVNYELPNVPEDYVHRIGRTARAGGTGCAVSLVSPDETPLLKDIERLLRRSLPVAALPQFPITAPTHQPESQSGSERPGGTATQGRGDSNGQPRGDGRRYGRGQSHGGGNRGQSQGRGHGGGGRGDSRGQGQSLGQSRGGGQGQSRGNGNGQGQSRSGNGHSPGQFRGRGNGGAAGARQGQPSRQRSGPSRLA